MLQCRIHSCHDAAVYGWKPFVPASDSPAAFVSIGAEYPGFGEHGGAATMPCCAEHKRMIQRGRTRIETVIEFSYRGKSYRLEGRDEGKPCQQE